jgi:pimeloyl-ACP methyl ester carboxylesterase
MADNGDNPRSEEGDPTMTAASPAAADRTVIAADGVTLRATVHGSAPGTPLLLIAGTGYGGGTWPPDVIASFAEDRPVVVYDHRGTGRSGTSDALYTTRDLAADAATVIEDVAPGSAVHVLGHSMGGRVAQWLAIDRPELVDGLVLASSGSGGSPDGTAAGRSVPYHTALGLLRNGYRAHLAAQIRSTFFTESFAADSPERVTWLIDAFWSSRPNLAEYLKHVVARQGHDTSDQLGRIRARTLVIVGARDTHQRGTGSHVAQSEELAARIPGATLQAVEGVAHGLFWQWPERTLDVVRPWLAA